MCLKRGTDAMGRKQEIAA